MTGTSRWSRHSSLTTPAPTGNQAARAARAARPTDVLWSTEELSRWAVIVIASAITCSVGWYIASGEGHWNHQIVDVDFCVIGLIAASSANILLLLAGRRATGARRVALLGEPAAETAQPVAGPVNTTQAVSSVLVAQPGLTRFHRSDCVMAADRGWSSASRMDHELAGRTPCGVCQP